SANERRQGFMPCASLVTPGNPSMLTSYHERGDHHRSRLNNTRKKWGLCWSSASLLRLNPELDHRACKPLGLAASLNRGSNLNCPIAKSSRMKMLRLAPTLFRASALSLRARQAH